VEALEFEESVCVKGQALGCQGEDELPVGESGPCAPQQQLAHTAPRVGKRFGVGMASWRNGAECVRRAEASATHV
jgi:hypothetical protein